MKYLPRITSLLFATLLLFLTSSSCKDKKPQPSNDFCINNPQLCETPMEAKLYFSFKVGSWWVYEEETTHERDSLYVTEYADDPTSTNFTTRIYSPNQDFFYVYYPVSSSGNGCNDNGISSGRCIYVKRVKTKPGNYVGEENCFFIQHKKNDQIGTSNVQFWDDKITVSEVYYDSFTLGDLTFNRTVKIHEGHTFIENNNPTYHYFAKGVGLIRKELLDSNEVWNLVNYHIEP
jgi:hypothetical protein